MKFGTLQVFPRQGVLQEHGLDLPTAVVGRGEGSGILIDDFSVSRRHARLTVESSRLLVEDLGSVGGTFVNDVRLEPGVRHLVDADAVLKFGEIEARYLPIGGAEAPAPSAAAPVEEPAELVESGLSVALASPTQAFEPGRSVDATLVVVNRGRLVDNVRIELPTLPADWYSVDTPTFPILPGGRADVKITLHPPRRFNATAGEYDFTVRVVSQEYDEHPEAVGYFQLLPFESAEITLEAVRSKKRFRVLAENHGNDVARYQLAGRDDEQIFKYAFETPVVELQPGEKRIVGLAVNRPRQLFGYASQPPFEVVGRNAAGNEITARGQLAVNPPLQRFKMPVAMTLVVALLAITALAVFIVADDDGTRTASAEDPYAGVHLCEDADAKAEQEERNRDAANDKPLAGATVVGPYDGGTPIFGQVDSTGAPFFAQSDPRWGGDEYARSTELPNGKDWCGTTIEQCGCAMTSVSVMLALYGLLEMPGGENLSPQALNNWFNGAARQTDRGWVSRGYIYGDVIWAAANELSGEIAKVKPETRTVRFVRTGTGSEEEIRADLLQGRPVIVEVPGHWIAAVGLDGDEILINDPFYRDRKTLSAYAGKVRSSVHYEPSSDLSSVVITAPADVKFRITDKQGRVVNTGLGTLDQPTDQVNQIPGASVAQKHAWRDPTCIESAPPADAGTNQVVLPGSRDDYVVEIIETGSQGGSVAIHTYGRDGTSSIATIEGDEGTKAELQFDPNADKPIINITNGGGNNGATTPTPDADGAGGGEDETPTAIPSPLAPPTATQTPFVEQRTAMTLPAEAGQTRVEVATNSGFELGDPIRFAPGLPNQEDNLIVGFGSFILATPLQFSHGPGEPILRLPRPPGQGPGLPPGITPPPDIGPIEPPDQVQLACDTIYQSSPKMATVLCDVQVVGDFTTVRWTMNGQVVTEFSGSTTFLMIFPGDTPANVSATVCNVTMCRSTTRNENVQFPAPSGTNSGGGTTTGTGGGSGAAPTPAAGQVTVTCATEFPITPDGQLAKFVCTANFSGDFTSISWSAPGGNPANGSGISKTFETTVRNTPGAPVTLNVTATVCNFGTCRTSPSAAVGITKTITTLLSSPVDEVNQGHKLTLMARVTGLSAPGSRTIAPTPSGGTVQFYVDGSPIGQSVGLITSGAIAIAPLAVPTNGLSTAGAGTAHQFIAVYSGGVNAFGSASDDGAAEPMNITILPPLPDGCDAINNDADPDNDGQLDDDYTDATCHIKVPKDLGAGTILNSVLISGPGVERDGADNAAILDPGEAFSVTGTAGRGEYCPGCLRQIYIGIGSSDPPAGSMDPMPTPFASGPQCWNIFIPPQAPNGSNYGFGFHAPTVPGVYYLRATTTLDYFCVGTNVGPPETSVGRIIVRAPVTAAIETWNWRTGCTGTSSTALLHCAWGDDGPTPRPGPALPNPFSTNPVSGISDGERLLLRATVPPGSTGRVEFATSPLSNVLLANNGGVASAQICPESGRLSVPSGATRVQIPCTPWEARIVTDPIPAIIASTCSTTALDPDPPVCITATYIDPDRVILPDPADPSPTTPFDEKPYDIRIPANPGSNTLPFRILAETTVTTTHSPATVQMGSDLELTADVVSTIGTLGLNGAGGKVQFWAGTNKIGDLVNVDGSGQAKLSWRVGLATPICTYITGFGGVGAPACGSFQPFDTHDDGAPDFYDDVWGEYITGGASLLQSHCSTETGGAAIMGHAKPNCHETNVDIDPAGSSTTISSVVPPGGSIGTSFEITAVVTVSEFSPVGGTVTFYEDDDSLRAVTIISAHCSAGPNFVCTVPSGSITTGGGSDEIRIAGTYDLTAAFGGTSQVEDSTSAVTEAIFTRQSPGISITMPGSQEVGTSATIRAELTGAVPANFNDNGAQVLFKHNGSTLVGGAQNIDESLPGGGVGALFNVQNLPAGTYNITVEYTGNGFYDPITSDADLGTAGIQPFTQVITQHTPTVTLDSITAVAVGGNLTISGNVSGTSSSMRTPAGGSVSFYLGGIGGTLLGTDSSIAGDGDVSISVETGDGKPLPDACAGAGDVAPCEYTNIVAHFNGNATNGNLTAATSSAGSVTLNKKSSTVTMTGGATAVQGTNITLQATVTATTPPTHPVSVACTACLQFQVNIGSVAPNWVDVGADVDVSSAGAASLSVATGSAPFTNVGSYSVRAIYANPGTANGQTTNGHVNYNTNTSSGVNITVTPTAGSVTVTGTSIVYLADGTVSATITHATGTPTCDDCVNFKVGATYATAVTFATNRDVNFVGGVYRATTSITAGGTNFPNVGTYTIWAEYEGNSTVGPAASATGATVTITAAPTTVNINSGNSNGPIGTSQNFGIVTPTGVAGTVKLFLGATELDSEPADSDGSSTLEWIPGFPAGTVQLHATFTPTSSNYSASTSPNRAFTVQPLQVSVVITANGANGVGGDGDVDVNVGSTVTFRATLSVGSPGVLADITGTVQFRRNSANFGTAVTVVNGIAEITWTAEAEDDFEFSVIFTSTNANYDDALATDSIDVETHDP